MAGWFGLVSGASAAQLHRSGKAVVEEVCIKCHGPGTDGAPRIGNRADWTPRAKDGLPRLLRSSMDGYRKMPAHGGQPGLTDLEMTRAIAYMVSGGKTPEPTARRRSATELPGGRDWKKASTNWCCRRRTGITRCRPAAGLRT
jgi:cytochrome c5